MGFAGLFEESTAREYAGMPTGQVGKLALTCDIAQCPNAGIGHRSQLVAALNAAPVIFHAARFKVEAIHDGTPTNSHEQMTAADLFDAVFRLRIHSNIACRTRDLGRLVACQDRHAFFALSFNRNRRVSGVYTFLQMAMPFIGFALAVMLPALIFRNRRAIRAV